MLTYLRSLRPLTLCLSVSIFFTLLRDTYVLLLCSLLASSLCLLVSMLLTLFRCICLLYYYYYYAFSWHDALPWILEKGRYVAQKRSTQLINC